MSQLRLLPFDAWLQRRASFASGILLLIFFAVLVIQGLQLHSRRFVAEVAAMATRHAQGAELFPPLRILMDAEVTVYFPGLPLLTSWLVRAGLTGDWLFYALVALAGCALISLFALQTRIVRNHDPCGNILYYVGFALSFLIIARMYRFYAVGFKPDTLAAALGLAGALLGAARKDMSSSIAAGLLIGLPIIFKQQYIGFFVSAVFCFAIRRRFAVCVCAAAAFACMMWLIHSVPNAWTYTVFALQDQGFNSIAQMLPFHRHMAFFAGAVALTCAAVYAMAWWRKEATAMKPFTSWAADSAKFVAGKLKIHTDPVFMGLLGFSAASYASSFKLGGNAGNVELAAMLLLPYAWLTLRHLFQHIPITLFFLCVLLGCVRAGVIETRKLEEFRPAFAELREAYAERFDSVPHSLLSLSEYYYAYSDDLRERPGQQEVALYSDTPLRIGKREIENFFQARHGDKNIVVIDIPQTQFRDIYDQFGGAVVFQNHTGMILFFPRSFPGSFPDFSPDFSPGFSPGREAP